MTGMHVSLILFTVTAMNREQSKKAEGILHQSFQQLQLPTRQFLEGSRAYVVYDSGRGYIPT